MGFHRHRLVSLLNGTQALRMPNNSGFIDISSLPLNVYNLHTKRNVLEDEDDKRISTGEWLKSFCDVGFNDLACFPRTAPPPEGLDCEYTNHIFTPSSHIPLEEQHKAKYLIDVDGNSFSGRYRDFLRSGSLPVKATVFREWHDSRLVPWRHFVPLDNRMLDLFGVLEFFVGYPEDPTSTSPPSPPDFHDEVFENPHNPSPSPQNDLPPGTAESKLKPRAPTTLNLNPTYPNNHDDLARKIAEEGRDWAEKVLRVEDMRVYTLRLLLEYARVMDPERERLGWIGDILGEGGEGEVE